MHTSTPTCGHMQILHTYLHVLCTYTHVVFTKISVFNAIIKTFVGPAFKFGVLSSNIIVTDDLHNNELLTGSIQHIQQTFIIEVLCNSV